MSNQARSNKERFERELSHYRSRIKLNKRVLEGKPFLAVHFNFWMESLRFLITALDFWDYTRNPEKYQETIDRIEKALKHMDKLMISLEDENYLDEDTDPEI